MLNAGEGVSTYKETTLLGWCFWDVSDRCSGDLASSESGWNLSDIPSKPCMLRDYATSIEADGVHT